MEGRKDGGRLGRKKGQMKEAVLFELSDPVTQSRPICPELV